MLTIPGTRSNTQIEFRRGPGGTIQTREVSADRSAPVLWKNLSRLEVIFYLNCGGVVGLWLDDLRRQGHIKTREKRRALAAAS